MVGCSVGCFPSGLFVCFFRHSVDLTCVVMCIIGVRIFWLFFPALSSLAHSNCFDYPHPCPTPTSTPHSPVHPSLSLLFPFVPVPLAGVKNLQPKPILRPGAGIGLRTGPTGLRPGGGTARLRPGGASLGAGAGGGGGGPGVGGGGGGGGSGAGPSVHRVNPVRQNAPEVPKEFVPLGSKDESNRMVYSQLELITYSGLTER